MSEPPNTNATTIEREPNPVATPRITAGAPPPITLPIVDELFLIVSDMALVDHVNPHVTSEVCVQATVEHIRSLPVAEQQRWLTKFASVKHFLERVSFHTSADMQTTESETEPYIEPI